MTHQIENTITETSENLVLRGTNTIKVGKLLNHASWHVVQDAVDYPVHITNAYYKVDGESVNANGLSAGGREKHYNLVVVDKYRTGDLQVINSVTGMYGTIDTKTVYNDFQIQLDALDEDYHVESLYVSGNGGSQKLTIEMHDMNSMNNVPDEMVMRIRLNTSVDGTSFHNLTMMAHNKTGDVSTAVYGGDYKLAARHTKTLDDRSIDFIPQILEMVKHWNNTLMPMFELMFDKKFDRKTAIELVEGLSKEAGLTERHQAKIVSLYETGSIRTNDKSDSLFRINNTIGQYIEDELESEGLKERMRNGLAKSITKHM